MDFFGQKLINARSVRGYTQRELAERADVSVIQLHRYETGKVTPRALAVKKLATALSVPIEWLTSNRGVDNVPNVDAQTAVTFQLPINLINSIEELAQENSRSVNEQAIFMLEYALGLLNQPKDEYSAISTTFADQSFKAGVQKAIEKIAENTLSQIAKDIKKQLNEQREKDIDDLHKLASKSFSDIAEEELELIKARIASEKENLKKRP